MSDAPNNINSKDELYQRLGQELVNQLGRSDGAHVAKSLHTQLRQDGTDWFDGHILRYFSGLPDNEWPDDRWPGHGYEFSMIMCTRALWLFQTMRSIVAAKERRYVPEENIGWFTRWLLRLNIANIGELEAKQAAEEWLPVYQQADHTGQRAMFIGTLGANLPEIQGKQPLLGAYAVTLDLRVQATTAMAFGDVADARKLQAEAVSSEQKLDAAIELYSTGGGCCYVLENDQGLLLIQLEGNRCFCIWSRAEDAEEINKAHYGGIHRISPMSYRYLEGQLEEMQSTGVRMALIDQCMNEEGRILPIESLSALVRQQISAAETSESGRAIKYLFEE